MLNLTDKQVIERFRVSGIGQVMLTQTKLFRPPRQPCVTGINNGVADSCTLAESLSQPVPELDTARVTVPVASPARKRGRPPGTRTEKVSAADGTTGPKRRGRPPLNRPEPAAAAAANGIADTSGGGASVPKRARLCPPSSTSASAGAPRNSTLCCSETDRRYNMCAESLQLLRSWWGRSSFEQNEFHDRYGCELLYTDSKSTRCHIAAQFDWDAVLDLEDGDQLHSPQNYFTTVSGTEFTARIVLTRCDEEEEDNYKRSVGCLKFNVEVHGAHKVSDLSLQVFQTDAHGSACTLGHSAASHSHKDGLLIREEELAKYECKNDFTVRVLLSFAVRG